MTKRCATTPFATASQGPMKRSSAFPREGQMSSSDGQEVMQRGIGFKEYQVSDIKQLCQFQNSTYYLGKENSGQRKRRQPVRTFFIKTVVAETRRQSRRIQAEVMALRRLSAHPTIMSLLDSGVSTIQVTTNDAVPREIACATDKLDRKRLYCFLFEHHSDQTLREFLEAQRQGKIRNRRSGIFRSGKVPDSPSPDFLDSAVALDIFRQMVDAVSFLHRPIDRPTKSESREIESSDESRDKPGILHLSISPDAFLVEQVKGDAGIQYRVKLCGLGCAMRSLVPLVSADENENARMLIEVATAPMYRAPEMINLHMSSELGEGVDIWALGCCLYELLFFRQCFNDHNQVFGIDQKTELTVDPPFYAIPDQHPHGKGELDLLSRLLTFKPADRASTKEVLKCLDALEEGRSLPPRKKAINCTFDTESETSSDAASNTAINIGDAIELKESTEDEQEDGMPDDEKNATSSCGGDDEMGDSEASDDELATRVMGLLSSEAASDADSSFSSGIEIGEELESVDMGEMMRRAHTDTRGAEATILLLGGKPVQEYSYSSSDDDSFPELWAKTDGGIGDGFEHEVGDKRLQEARLCSQHAILNSIAGDSDSSVKVYAASEDMTSESESESALMPVCYTNGAPVEGSTASDGFRTNSPLDLHQSSNHSSSWLEFDPYEGAHSNLTQKVGPSVVSTPELCRHKPSSRNDNSMDESYQVDELLSLHGNESHPFNSSKSKESNDDDDDEAPLPLDDGLHNERTTVSQEEAFSGPFLDDDILGTEFMRSGSSDGLMFSPEVGMRLDTKDGMWRPAGAMDDAPARSGQHAESSSTPYIDANIELTLSANHEAGKLPHREPERVYKPKISPLPINDEKELASPMDYAMPIRDVPDQNVHRKPSHVEVTRVSPESHRFDQENSEGMPSLEVTGNLLGDDSNDKPCGVLDGLCTALFDDDALDVSGISSTRVNIVATLDMEKQPELEQRSSPHDVIPLSRKVTSRISNCSIIKTIDPEDQHAIAIPELSANSNECHPQEQARSDRGRDRTARGHGMKKKKKKKKSSLERDMRKLSPAGQSQHPWAPRAFSPSTSSNDRKRIAKKKVGQVGGSTSSSVYTTRASALRQDNSPPPPPSPSPASHLPTPWSSDMWSSLRF